MRMPRAAVAVAVGLVTGLAVAVVPAPGPAAPPPSTVPPSTEADEPTHPLRWLALGDSYSSGEGVEENYGECAQSPGAYAAEAFHQLKTDGFPLDEQDFLACSGAQVPDVTESVDLVEQIEQATGHYDLITFTIGGNDAGFGDVLTECLLEFCADEDELLSRVDAVRPKLVTIYGRIIDELLAPGGHIVVLGYPRIFEPPSTWAWYIGNSCELIYRQDADLIRRLADRLNGLIADVAESYDNVHFLDIADAFEGHNLCVGWGTSGEWINGISTGWDSNRWPGRHMHSFHPNRAGHAAEAALLADYVKGLDWTQLQSATVTLRYRGLTVSSGQRTVVADLGQPPEPSGGSLEEDISDVLGEPVFSTAATGPLAACAGVFDRMVMWGPSRGEPPVLVATFTGEGGAAELVGYQTHRSSPDLRLADDVSIGSPAAALLDAYAGTDVRLASTHTYPGGTGVGFELVGRDLRGPEFGTFSGPGDGAEIRDSGARCGAGPWPADGAY